jgi:hypothetical protein
MGMLKRPPFLLLVTALAACAGPEPPPAAVAPSLAALPTGAAVSASGFLDIRQAPPPPFPAEPPPEPQVVDDFSRRTSSADPAVRARAWEEANGSAAFQAELQRLGQLLHREQRDTFVQVRIVRDPTVAAEVWFTRDAAQTLARYTSNPLFRPRQGGLTLAEQERLSRLWSERAEGGSVISMIGVDPRGSIEIGSAVEETEFRRIAKERGWELGPELKLTFPPPRPLAFTDPGLARYVRTFARETKAKGIQLTAGFSGRIVLADGCFRLAERESGKPGALVMFGRDTQLTRDEQGYLTVLGERGQRRYRVGDLGSWPGPNEVNETDPEVRQLRRVCGEGPLTNVAEPESERLFALPYPQWLADYARARRISYRSAWTEVTACYEREERRGRRGLQARERCIKQFN